MEDNDSQNSPFTRSKCIQDLPDALVNQKGGKEGRSREREHINRESNLARRSHVETNSGARRKMRLSREDSLAQRRRNFA
jgi:hypothetical protein